MYSKETHLLIYLYVLRDNLISGITFNTFYTGGQKNYIKVRYFDFALHLLQYLLNVLICLIVDKV